MTETPDSSAELVDTRISLEMARPTYATDVILLIYSYVGGFNRGIANWQDTGQELADSLRVAGWEIPEGDTDSWTTHHPDSSQKLRYAAPALTLA